MSAREPRPAAHRAARVGELEGVAVGDAEPLGGRRMHRGERLGLRRGELGHAAGLRAALVVLEQPPGHERELAVGRPRARRVAHRHGDEPGEPVGVREAVGEEAGRAGAAARERPVRGLAAVEHGVVDARSSRRCRPRTRVAAPRTRARGRCRTSPCSSRRRASSARIHSSSRTPAGGVIARRRRRTRPSRLVMVPSSSAHWVIGQHDVGEGRGLGEEEVADHEQVEPRRCPRARPRRSATTPRGWSRARAARARRPGARATAAARRRARRARG